MRVANEQAAKADKSMMINLLARTNLNVSKTNKCQQNEMKLGPPVEWGIFF